jgi:hypothetical protein
MLAFAYYIRHSDASRGSSGSSDVPPGAHLAYRECYIAGEVGYGELTMETIVHRQCASAG